MTSIEVEMRIGSMNILAEHGMLEAYVVGLLPLVNDTWGLTGCRRNDIKGRWMSSMSAYAPSISLGTRVRAEYLANHP